MSLLQRASGIVLLLAVPACTAGSDRAAPPASGDSDYLYLWTASTDSTSPDFLTVVDVRPDTGRYGAVVTTLPAGRGNTPHHSEHELAADDQLFVNGFNGGLSFVFDLRDGRRPRLVTEFGERAGYHHPHSFLRLPNGNVLATFQMRLAITGYGALEKRVLIATFDSASGALALNARFRDAGATTPGMTLSGPWPHGATAPGAPHGAVFSRASSSALARKP